MWFAGIDGADVHHDVVVIDGEGHHVGVRRVTPTPEGLTELTEFLAAITGPERKAELACIIETTHGLLIAALLEAGYPVYPVNPKTVDRKRGAAGAKTDQIDAYLLAKHGRSEFADLRRLEPDSPLVAELKTLTRDQDSLIQMQTRLVNQLTACLKAYYPVALTLFTKLQQRSTLTFLQAYPTPQVARQATALDIAVVLKQAGHPTPEQVAAKLVETLHQPALHADEVTTRTKSRLMVALVDQLLPVIEAIASYDQEIKRLFLTHADSSLMRSLPRAGKRLAPRLLAELGEDRRRYQNAASLQALAGTSPVPYESGKYAKPHRRYACIKPLRNVLQQFAWQSTQKEAWALDYYQRKRAQGKSHSVAVRALATIWCRIIFALWTKRERYQTSLFEAAQQRQAPRPA
jgi:transposase